MGGAGEMRPRERKYELYEYNVDNQREPNGGVYLHAQNEIPRINRK